MEKWVNCGKIMPATCVISDLSDFLGAVRTISESLGTHIICFDAEKLAGVAHARMAVAHAARAWASKSPIAKTFEMEALLYAAGSRQTSLGSSFGVHIGRNNIYVCSFPFREGIWENLSPLMDFFKENDPWGIIDSEKESALMRLFDITPLELSTLMEETVQDLVLERVALLEVSR